MTACPGGGRLSEASGGMSLSLFEMTARRVGALMREHVNDGHHDSPKGFINATEKMAEPSIKETHIKMECPAVSRPDNDASSVCCVAQTPADRNEVC